MKTFLPISAARGAVILGLSVVIGSAHGATTNTTAPVGKKKARAAAALATTGAIAPTATANAVARLDQAYGLLRQADHDYKGHRARAMHQIEDAARELGAALSGDGKAGEKQATSDSQLHNAQSLLQQAVGEITGKPHHHVAQAINQLNIALSVK